MHLIFAKRKTRKASKWKYLIDQKEGYIDKDGNFLITCSGMTLHLPSEVSRKDTMRLRVVPGHWYYIWLE